MIKTGIGQDSHRFEPDTSSKVLMLGGVAIPGCLGLLGNSDADVVLHALTNAVSGITGNNILGSISDAMCLQQGITDSKRYLEAALASLDCWKLTHVSVTIEAKRPHLQQHIPVIRTSLASLIGLTPADIGVTATTGEGLTAFGRGEGIQVFVIVTAVHCSLLSYAENARASGK
jgi:2-C-methyl-D-erythritol 2,4-cyclodiphosphate synthase